MFDIKTHRLLEEIKDLLEKIYDNKYEGTVVLNYAKGGGAVACDKYVGKDKK